MKRFGALFVALVMTVVMIGCGNHDEPQPVTGGKWNPNMIGRQLTLRPVALASSAGALTLTPGSFFQISGTETITSIATSAADAGRIVIFVHNGNCTFTDGSNLKLAGNITMSSNDILVLIGDGTNFYEVCRSVN
jgi:hypothetical protein